MTKENDLIRRGDVERIISEGLNNNIYGYDAVCILAELSEIPAIEQPISAVVYYEIWHRMCSCYSRELCRGCPLFIRNECRMNGLPTHQNIAAIRKWAREHPERATGEE